MFKFLTKQTIDDKELIKTSTKISKGLNTIFNSKKITDETLEELETLLISTDLNIYLVNDILHFLKENRYNKDTTIEDIKEIIFSKLEKIFKKINNQEINFNTQPYTILFLGVNGSGKTTFIGKLANKLVKEGKKVLLAGCDTFRAGAKEQLSIWAERANCDIINAEKDKEDPAALAFKAYNKAKSENYDVLLIDTAGRLQNNTNLMLELTKIQNVLKKHNSLTPNKIFLVLDATIGQNSINQAELFNEAVKIDGIIMNKLDGTAKGGCLVSIADKFKKEIVAIGIGEGIEDIRDFDYKVYLQNLLNL